MYMYVPVYIYIFIYIYMIYIYIYIHSAFLSKLKSVCPIVFVFAHYLLVCLTNVSASQQAIQPVHKQANCQTSGHQASQQASEYIRWKLQNLFTRFIRKAGGGD